MRRLMVSVLAALLVPVLTSAHPVDMGNDVAIDVHLVDATTGERFEAFRHESLPTGRGDPLLSNRSYLLEVRLLDGGEPVDGRVSAIYNGSTRHYATTDGVARFPVGNPLGATFRADVFGLPAGWETTTWETFHWLVLDGDGAREPEPQDRWGYAGNDTWRTHAFTATEAGYLHAILSWGGLGDGAGGLFGLIHINDTVTEDWLWLWSAANGPGGVRVTAASLGEEARLHIASPVTFGGGGGAIHAEGVVPAGSVITFTHAVVNPANPSRFRLEMEADDGVLTHAVTATGRATVHGGDGFAGGREATVTLAGNGYSDRYAREATIDLPTGGTVLLHASPSASEGTFAWRHHGEEAAARVYGRDYFWKATGACAGEWWRRMDASAFGESWFNVLHLEDHAFPEDIDRGFDHAIGGGGCRRPAP